MSAAVVLDSGPLGLLANPRLTPTTAAALQWLGRLMAAGRRVLAPALADYEVRRELLRLNAVRSLQSLDALIQQLEFLPESSLERRVYQVEQFLELIEEYNLSLGDDA